MQPRHSLVVARDCRSVRPAPRRWAAAVGTAAATLLLVFLSVFGGVGSASAQTGAVPAGVAAADDVQVSSDGVHFSTSLPAGLFDLYGALIPNGSMRASLWIQNPSDQPAMLRVSLRGREGASAVLNDYLTLRVTTPAEATPSAPSLGGDQNCALLAPAQPLAAGATLRADVTIAMMNVTGLTAQNERADLGLVVALRGAEAGPFSPSACDEDGVLVALTPGSPTAERPAALPGTGFDLPVPALIGGGLLLGVGMLLVTRRRRERHEP